MNIWANLLIILISADIISTPFIWGKERPAYGWPYLIGNIISLILVLLALGLKVSVSL